MLGKGELVSESTACWNWLTQDLRCLFVDSLLAELHDQQYKLHLRHPRFHSVYSVSGSLLEYDLILDSDLCPETLMI